MAQGMLRVVQPCSGKPLCTGHRVRPQHPLVGLRGTNVEVLPERTPESLQVVDGPLPERRVGIEAPSPLLEPTKIVSELCPLDARGAGSPEQFALFNAVHQKLRAAALITARRRRRSTKPRE